MCVKKLQAQHKKKIFFFACACDRLNKGSDGMVDMNSLGLFDFKSYPFKSDLPYCNLLLLTVTHIWHLQPIVTMGFGLGNS